MNKKPLKISVRTIPYREMKEKYYDTVGNWWFKNDNEFVILVAETGNWRTDLLIAVHELIEMALCKHRNITEEEVTNFDLDFEKQGKQGEPGDDKNAPYRNEHFFAECLERLFCSELGISWRDYDKAIPK